jgi:curved DNA-binding protein CbpA
MTQREALDVLGFDESASEQDILRAYRELMKRVHPDKPGGSTYLAARLNEARETLLG